MPFNIPQVCRPGVKIIAGSENKRMKKLHRRFLSFGELTVDFWYAVQRDKINRYFS